MLQDFNQTEIKKILAGAKEIFCFETGANNIDQKVVESFGEEWKKFNEFNEGEIQSIGKMYFDIIDDTIVNKNTYGIDIGCGSGRWTKCLSDRIGFMEAIDPSQAIFSAAHLLKDVTNVRLSQASTDNIPFNDETFDFAMSVGVLHHIPDTKKALADCVKKVKIGGYFYTYLYYDLENKGIIFKGLLKIVNVIRIMISSLPSFLKKVFCDIIAILVYMPLVLFGRLLNSIGLKQLSKKIPLSPYQDKSFFVIRNDALDRFGTSLEQRFSRAEIKEMMENAGLTNVVIADTVPYWHAVGKRII